MTGRQSDERVPGRRVPPSFGRQEQEPVQDFTIRGGQAFHLVLHIDAVPTPVSLDGLYAQVKATVSQAIRDAYAETVGVPLPDPAQEQVGGHGGAPAGTEPG